MGLFRLLFWIALIAIAFWLWRRFTRPTPRQQQRPQDEPGASPMVRCAHCGVHVPQANALAHEQRWGAPAPGPGRPCALNGYG
ncbi:PP0621 family protein [Pseudomonas aeruginosa]|uniref:PP0621 family protein n=2 Tax=Pseudomonas aeruginosa TaxID=287 RepID=UPI002738A99A|nr:PP0621 family protein [Pseudomonas aeruginosa]